MSKNKFPYITLKENRKPISLNDFLNERKMNKINGKKLDDEKNVLYTIGTTL